MRERDAAGFAVGGVSIHAPRCRGAMLSRHRQMGCAAARFNPRPPLPRGDALGGGCHSTNLWSFNPRPPLPRGDAPELTNRRSHSFVSIHAPRCRGAMLNDLADPLVFIPFQSTPPVAEGRCTPNRNLRGSKKLVSIHAPRCRGAMQFTSSVRDGSSFVSIHAPRCRGAMPHHDAAQRCANQFQSTPPVAEGRCLLSMVTSWR